MTTERRHRRHPAELKLRLVESYLAGEGSIKSIAKAHDITHTLLMIWVDKYRRGELTEEIDHVERSREAEGKIAALERKVGQLTMELDVLKKMRSAPTVANGERALLELAEAPEGEEIAFDYAATGLTVRRHPLALLGPLLAERRLLSAAELQDVPNGRLVRTWPRCVSKTSVSSNRA